MAEEKEEQPRGPDVEDMGLGSGLEGWRLRVLGVCIFCFLHVAFDFMPIFSFVSFSFCHPFRVSQTHFVDSV